jgi:hypothetical protein
MVFITATGATVLAALIGAGATVLVSLIQRPKRNQKDLGYYDASLYYNPYETLTTYTLYDQATGYTQTPSYYTTPFQTTMYYYR